MKQDRIPFEMQAELCSALGHATRLRMIRLLKTGPQCVNQIAEALHVSPSTASRHLTVLRIAGILAVQRHGTDMLYRVANPTILEICNLLLGVLARRESQRSEVLRELQLAEPERSPYAR